LWCAVVAVLGSPACAAPPRWWLVRGGGRARLSRVGCAASLVAGARVAIRSTDEPTRAHPFWTAA